jgi:hypothetical protein
LSTWPLAPLPNPPSLFPHPCVPPPPRKSLHTGPTSSPPHTPSLPLHSPCPKNWANGFCAPACFCASCCSSPRSPCRSYILRFCQVSRSASPHHAVLLPDRLRRYSQSPAAPLRPAPHSHTHTRTHLIIRQHLVRLGNLNKLFMRRLVRVDVGVILFRQALRCQRWECARRARHASGMNAPSGQ